MTQDLVLVKEINESKDTILGVYTFYSVYAIKHMSRTGIHAVAKGTALQGGDHIAGILYDVTTGAICSILWAKERSLHLPDSTEHFENLVGFCIFNFLTPTRSLATHLQLWVGTDSGEWFSPFYRIFARFENPNENRKCKSNLPF